MRPSRARLKSLLGGGGGSSGPKGTRSKLSPLREEYFAPDHVHGAHPLGVAASASFKALADLAGDPTLGEYALEEALFLDTETTGLSGGAGTLVFMCGTARFLGDGRLLFRQHFLNGPGSEEEFLRGVLEDLEATKVLVTFSGKSFDRHRLADRLVQKGMDEEIRKRPHLDLLHLSRRVWKRILPDTKLRTLEERVLKLIRQEDLPGSECPRLYLDWLRGHVVELEPAFLHNRLDVLSLVTLMALLGQDPWAGAVPRPLLAAHGVRLERAEPLRAALLFGRAGRALEQARALIRGEAHEEALVILKVLAEEEDREAIFSLGLLLAGTLERWEEAVVHLRGTMERFHPGEKAYERANRLLARYGRKK